MATQSARPRTQEVASLHQAACVECPLQFVPAHKRPVARPPIATVGPFLRRVGYRDGRDYGAVTGVVKVFGCRPSQVAPQCVGPAYGNRPSTNPRGCGDGLWGFEVLLCCGDGAAG